MSALSTTKVAIGMFTIAISSLVFAGVNLHRKYSLLKTPVAYYMERQHISGVSNLVKDVNGAIEATQRIEIKNPAAVDVFKIQKGVITFNTEATPGIVFRVQVLASKNQVPIFSSEFKGLNLREYYVNGVYKYTVGEFKSPAQSESLLSNLTAMGYDDSFIVAFKDGKSIPVKEAMKKI